MTDQVEVQEKVRWEDLEVASTDEIVWLEKGAEEYRMTVTEFIKYCGGRVDSAIQFAQANPSVAEVIAEEYQLVKGLTPVINGPEWVTAHDDAECVECFDPLCGIDPAKPGGDFTAWVDAMAQGIVLAFGISAEDFAEVSEGLARAALDQELRFAEIPVLDWREANERLPSISEIVAGINAFLYSIQNLSDRAVAIRKSRKQTISI